jgi:hypothetical protein
MAIDFPTSPTLNQVYTFNSISWIWNGSYWDNYSPSQTVVNQIIAGTNITLSPSGGTGNVIVSSTISALTQTQRTSISSPYVGLIVYQTDGSDGLYVYKNSGWVQMI